MSTTVTKRRLMQNPDMPLAEKLKHHYQNRDFSVQPASASKLGLTATAVMNVSLLLESLFVLLPTLYAAGEDGVRRTGWFGEGFWLMVAVVVFLWVEFTWNWWRAYFDVPNWVTKELKATHFGQMLDTPPGWKHCPTCQVDAPPRSHHCNHCGHCILKRDHHCFFTGSCIGHYTQRHFVMFLCYTIVVCITALYLQTAYLQITMPTYTPATLVPLVLIYQLIGGSVSLTLGGFFMYVHLYLVVFFMITALVFLAWQLLIISRGQTSYEAWKMINIYNAGLFTNLTTTFGAAKYCWILLFLPLLLPMDSDGTKYPNKLGTEKAH